jgi:hypothetical protein
LTGFTGGGELTTQCLTKRQGRRHVEGFTHAGTGIIQDVENEIGGVNFVGIDHVLRLNGTRAEVFSGLAETSSAICGTGGWSSTGERRTPRARRGVPRGSRTTGTDRCPCVRTARHL